MIRRLIWLALFPGGLTVTAVFAAFQWLPSSPTVDSAWLLFPYLVLLLGSFYAIRFGRVRLLYMLGALVLLERLIMLAPAGAGGRMLFLAGAVLVPFNLALIGWMREKGFLTPVGVMRLLFFGLQVCGVVWLARQHLAETLSLLEREWGYLPVQLPLPDSVIAAATFGALLLLISAIRSPGVLNVSMCWSYALVIAAIVYPDYSVVILSTAGLVISLAVVEVTHFMAYRDELTGLPARRALNEYLAKLSGRYVLVMADVDHFKKVNDTYGHDVGDQVLRMVATRLLRVGGGGRVFRYGGEEFTLVFPGKTLETAQPFVEKVREAIAAEPFTMRGPGRKKQKPQQPPRNQKTAVQFSVTISFGMAEREDSSVSSHTLFKHADEALYKAKKNGRNRICR